MIKTFGGNQNMLRKIKSVMRDKSYCNRNDFFHIFHGGTPFNKVQ